MTGHDEAVQIARDALPADIRGRDMWARDVVAALTGEYDLAPKGELAALRAVREVVARYCERKWGGDPLVPLSEIEAALDAASTALFSGRTCDDPYHMVTWDDAAGTTSREV